MISQAIAATDKFFSDPVELRLYREKERARMDAMERDQYHEEVGEAKGKAEIIAKLLKQFPVAQVAGMLNLSEDYVSDVARHYGLH